MIQDLLGRTEYTDAQVRTRSIRALGFLGKDVHEDLMKDVVERLAELSEDKDTDVRNEARKVLGI